MCPFQTPDKLAFAFPAARHQLSSLGSKMSSSSGNGDTTDTLPTFNSEKEYLDYLHTVSQLPRGFATGSAEGKFTSAEAPSLGELPIRCTIISLTNGATDNWAAVFTTNKFPGAPVLVGRDRLEKGGPLQAVVINNKVSNVCSGGDGIADAELVCESVAAALRLPGGGRTVLPSSTGVIGWRLPAHELAKEIVPKAIVKLQSESILGAAQAIMTTDRYPKVRSKTLSNGARIVAIGKGAGMIEPNMATMLSYILTDATVPKAKLQQMLSDVVGKSFNSISVDGDESTSDTVTLLASNHFPLEDEDEFRHALENICIGLASDIVRNGEGTSHVIKVNVKNFPGTEKEARALGRHIVNSPLVKCAVNGNDPNTGRIAGAIGSFMGKFKRNESVDKMSLTLGGRCIFSNKKFVLEGDKVEKELSNHMKDAEYGDATSYPPHQKFVEVGVDFNSGTSSAVVIGSDLSKEYVSVNADYRS